MPQKAKASECTSLKRMYLVQTYCQKTADSLLGEPQGPCWPVASRVLECNSFRREINEAYDFFGFCHCPILNHATYTLRPHYAVGEELRMQQQQCWTKPEGLLRNFHTTHGIDAGVSELTCMGVCRHIKHIEVCLLCII